MYKDLSHLADNEVTHLMQRYYGGESAIKLIKEYELSVRSSDLFKLFPPESFDNYHCEYCNLELVINRRSKSMKNAPKYESDLYCPKCGHRPYYSHCKCDNYIQEQARLETEQLEQIKVCYSKVRTPVEFSILSFEDKVYLGTLCRALLGCF